MQRALGASVAQRIIAAIVRPQLDVLVLNDAAQTSPNVSLPLLKMPAGFSASLYHPYTVPNARSLVASGNNKPGGPIITYVSTWQGNKVMRVQHAACCCLEAVVKVQRSCAARSCHPLVGRDIATSAMFICRFMPWWTKTEMVSLNS